MRLFIFSLLFSITTILYAEVKWDVPLNELGKLVGETHLIDLKEGASALIETGSVFCTDKDGHLALDGFTQTGSGDIQITLLKDKKISIKIETSSINDFLTDLVYNESFASCEWWTSHKGKYIFLIDNINGKNSIKALTQ